MYILKIISLKQTLDYRASYDNVSFQETGCYITMTVNHLWATGTLVNQKQPTIVYFLGIDTCNGSLKRTMF